jgi:spermidine synthase
VQTASTRRSILQFGGIAAALCIRPEIAPARPKELVRESAYNYIIVSQDGPVVSFRRMENGASVSAIDMNRPGYQVIPYTKVLFAASFIKPNPAQALSIGLGAGSFNRLFNLCYPDADLTTVEIDPMIRDLAVEFTKFQESAQNKVIIEDGRRFLHRSQDRWDWIVIDAFVKNSQYPPHMATHEFFALVAEHLSDGGILVINILRGNKLFDCLVTTITTVFHSCLSFDVPGRANAIVVASTSSSPPLQQRLKATSMPLLPLMKDNGVDLLQIQAAGAVASSIGCSVPLTDDFAPTEFLGDQWQR